VYPVPYTCKQVPTGTVVSMIAQSEQQLIYLVTNKDTNNLRVLLIPNIPENFITAVSYQVPTEYAARPLDYLLLSLTKTSKQLLWLRLLSSSAAPEFDGTEANIHLLPSLRILECAWCNQLSIRVDECAWRGQLSIRVNELKKLQYFDLNSCYSITTVQGLAELTALKYLNFYYAQITNDTLAGLRSLLNCNN
jgi:hypothetical protein